MNYIFVAGTGTLAENGAAAGLVAVMRWQKNSAKMSK
jgi:hypothetical protein